MVLLQTLIRSLALRRWKVLTLVRSMLPARTYPGRKLDVYWLSTGRCGTRFLYQVLATASNATVFHDRGCVKDSVDRAVAIYRENPEAFWNLPLESFPIVLTKVLENGKYHSEIYAELIHAIYPFGYMIWDYFRRKIGPSRKVKLIHLIRNPVACCRSILKVERDEEGGLGFLCGRAPGFIEGRNSAERAANLWIGINTLCREIIRRIDDPSVARIIRIENLDLDGIRDLFGFLELKGFDPGRISDLMANTSQDVRHSHLARPEIKTGNAAPEELEIVRRLTLRLAREFGYIPDQETVKH